MKKQTKRLCSQDVCVVCFELAKKFIDLAEKLKNFLASQMYKKRKTPENLGIKDGLDFSHAIFPF